MPAPLRGASERRVRGEADALGAARAARAGEVAGQALLVRPDLALAAVGRVVIAVFPAGIAGANHARAVRAARDAVVRSRARDGAISAVEGAVRQVGLAAVLADSVAVVPAAEAAVAVELAVQALAAGGDGVRRRAGGAARIVAAGVGVVVGNAFAAAGLLVRSALPIFQAVEVDERLAPGGERQRRGQRPGPRAVV